MTLRQGWSRGTNAWRIITEYLIPVEGQPPVSNMFPFRKHYRGYSAAEPSARPLIHGSIRHVGYPVDSQIKKRRLWENIAHNRCHWPLLKAHRASTVVLKLAPCLCKHRINAQGEDLHRKVLREGSVLFLDNSSCYFERSSINMKSPPAYSHLQRSGWSHDFARWKAVHASPWIG